MQFHLLNPAILDASKGTKRSVDETGWLGTSASVRQGPHLSCFCSM